MLYVGMRIRLDTCAASSKHTTGLWRLLCLTDIMVESAVITALVALFMCVCRIRVLGRSGNLVANLTTGLDAVQDTYNKQ